MKHTADVVVIGGGVNGCSIAYQLAKKGCRNVVILEKDQVAGGASGRCPGGFRHQWGTEADILLMSASIKLMTELQGELDPPWDLEVRQYGYLVLAHTEEELEQFRKNVALQRSLGILVELLDPQQAGELAPGLNTAGLLGATFCGWDGRASPYLITHAYARAARQLGVEIDTNTRVTGLRTSGGRISAVVTDGGVIETPRVVCVAGAASREIARMIDLDVPITPLRRNMLITEAVPRTAWPALLSHLVVLFQTPRGDAVYAGGSSKPEETMATEGDSLDFYVKALRSMVELMPNYSQVKVVRHWAGTYDMSPDAHPIVGAMPDVEGFYMAAGFSGHGFMMGPIVGMTMAETILGEPPSIDISALDASRFERGGQVVEKMVY